MVVTGECMPGYAANVATFGSRVPRSLYRRRNTSLKKYVCVSCSNAVECVMSEGDACCSVFRTTGRGLAEMLTGACLQPCLGVSKEHMLYEYECCTRSAVLLCVVRDCVGSDQLLWCRSISVSAICQGVSERFGIVFGVLIG